MPPIELLQDVLGYAVLPSVLAAATTFALVLLILGMRTAVLGGALALLAGLAVGNALRDIFPLRPGPAAWHWLPACAVLALLTDVLVSLPKIPRPLGWAARTAVAVLAAWLLVPVESRAEARWLLPTFAVVVLAEWVVLHSLARRQPGFTPPFEMACIFVAAALVLIHAHTARFADAATILAASLTGAAIVAGWWRAEVSGVMPGVAVLLPGLLLAGQSETYSEVPVWSFLLVALAPLTLALALLPWVPRLSARWQRLVSVLLLLVPLAVAVVLTLRAESLAFE